jgi:hypothetical protein
MLWQCGINDKAGAALRKEHLLFVVIVAAARAE